VKKISKMDSNLTPQDKPVKNHHINENTLPDAEYKAAMQSYLYRAAYLATDGTRAYPKRETLFGI
jgi:hypothetical protein